MPELEKRAWYQLAVAGVTALAWIAVYAVFRIPEVAMASFALLALSALPKVRLDRSFHDERDRAIAEHSHLIALRFVFAAAILAPVLTGLVLGWSFSVPVSTMAHAVWMVWLLMVSIQSTVTIAQYRRGHA